MSEKQLKDLLQTLPAKPGVYLMKDKRGEVIYVGKAVNLRSRVRSYFHTSAGHSPKLRRMAAKVADVDFIVTDSEVEALILECNLIKEYRPRYNVRLKDDKRYPYIKVTWQDDFPRIYVTRRLEQDGARYFGPYASAGAVHQTLDLLRKIFPYATCGRKITGRDERACLYYHLGRCLAPCIGAVSREEYRGMIEQLCLFLEGRTERVLADLKAKMKAAAENLEFERAALLRDQMRAVEKVTEGQKVVSLAGGDRDVIGWARENGEACVQVFFIREGKLIGRDYFILEGADEEDSKEVLSSFIKQFYNKATFIPPEILLPQEIEGTSTIQRWLGGKRGTEVTLKVPREGTGRELVEMAAENAAETLAALRSQRSMEESRNVQALAELQEYLKLERAPTRIEGYDISDIQGKSATGSMVVFVKGAPRKSEYRRFKIRTVEGIDDYAMLQEVLRRRLKRAEREKSGTWTLLPDLIVVDGGKGQLNAALEVLAEFGLDKQIPIVGLAKRREEVFIPESSRPLILPPGSQGRFLLQRIRDEAHRFAIGYHRKLRRKENLASILEEVPGIGPARRKALLKRFSSIEAIRKATVEELAAIPNMNAPLAERLKEYLS